VLSLFWTLIVGSGLGLAAIAAFLGYVHFRYTPIVARIFEEKPLFLPLRVAPTVEGEDVEFTTADGLRLAGTYLRATVDRRLGVVVFCHEYLSDRWSALAYAGHLRELGFDLFCFDFRNHGRSDSDPRYRPLQWVTDHELSDLRAAMRHLRSRPDADPAGVGLFGVSRGGGTALCAGGKDPNVWGVVTDGAFPTRGMMVAYMSRWAEIYVSAKSIWARMPVQVFEFLAWAARKKSQAKLHCRFPDVERAIARLSPRPLLMIHGEKDAYIGPQIARALFALAGQPKEIWIVPKAKHNRCREVDNPTYLLRVATFFLNAAPRVTSSVPKSRDAVVDRTEDSVTAAEPDPVATTAPAVVASNALSH